MLLAAIALATLAETAVSTPDDVNPTKRQKESLAVYVTAWTDRLATHLESTEKEVLERALRKATYNGISYRAEAKFDATIVDILMKDMGCKSKEVQRVFERELAPELIKLAVKDSASQLNRINFQYHHRQVLLHNKETLFQLEGMADEYDLTDKQRKAMRTLAEFYSKRMIELTGRTKDKKLLGELMTEALITLSTERAEVSARNKVRGLLRRKLVAEKKPKSDREILALDEEIVELLPRAFPETFWLELRFDHERCIIDPDEHRKILKNLMKGKKRPDHALPPHKKKEEGDETGEIPGSGDGQR